MRRFYDHQFSLKSEGDCNKARQWNRAAKRSGNSRRPLVLVVFDPFDFGVGPEKVHIFADNTRIRRLFNLIDGCEAIDWLLVTRYPENVRGLVPGRWLPFKTLGIEREWPENCFVGIRASSGADVDALAKKLSDVPAKTKVLILSPRQNLRIGSALKLTGARWAIATGREWAMHPDWIRAIRDDATSAKVPFWFESWGRWMPTSTGREFTKPRVEHGVDVVTKIGSDGMIYVSCAHGEYHDAQPVELLGPRRSGRILDGKEWIELPRSGERGSRD